MVPLSPNQDGIPSRKYSNCDEKSCLLKNILENIQVHTVVHSNIYIKIENKFLNKTDFKLESCFIFTKEFFLTVSYMETEI